MNKGGTIFSDAVFRKILSIGFEFETHDLAKLSLHKNKRYLINSDITLRILKEKKEVGTVKEIDDNYLSVRVHLSKDANDSLVEEEPNLDEMDEEEREFYLSYQDEIEQEKLEKYENDSFLEYFNENRPHDDKTKIKFQVTNDVGDGEFADMLAKDCDGLTLPKDQMYKFKTRAGKVYKLKFLDELKKACSTFSGVEYVITYYQPKKRENPDIILEHFVDACSRIIDHLGNLKTTKGTLFMEGDDKKTHFVTVGNIEDSRRIYRKPGTNLFYLETYDNVNTHAKKSLGSFEFIPQMTFRCKTEDALNIMKAILKPDHALKKDISTMEAIAVDYEKTNDVESIVDDLFETHNATSDKKIATNSPWFKTLKTYVFLIYYKLFAYIQNHNIILSKEDYLKDHLVFASRHSNYDLYVRIKQILKDHFAISDVEEVRALLSQPVVLEKIYEYVDFEDEDFDESGEYKYGEAHIDDLSPSNKNYGNPLYSILSYFKHFENPIKGEEDWLIHSGADSFSTRFDLKGDEIFLENRLFKDEVEVLLRNMINLKIKDGLLTVDAMNSLVKKLYGSKNIKHMMTLKRSPSKKSLSKKVHMVPPSHGLAQVKSRSKAQAIIAQVLKPPSRSKKTSRTTSKRTSHLKRASTKKQLSPIKEEPENI